MGKILQKKIVLKNFTIGNEYPVVLISGPCVIESEAHTIFMAEQISRITEELEIPYIFKTSYDKANRTSISAYRGPGLEEGLRILERVKKEVGVPLLVDVHEVSQIKKVAKVADVIQIPAFLCRQTDLVVNIAKTGLIVNVKKGQFLAPWDIKNVIEKIESQGNFKILLTERGVSFGYNNLVADMRSLVIMKNFGYPVVFDATHAVQLPGGLGSSTGGQSEFIPYLSCAATAIGIAGLFIEVHDNPKKAKSDGPNMLNLSVLKRTLTKVKKIDSLVKEYGGY
jgi:2-dehydro-3-deoxyphosphooctonate aldolase (KDO 8-P synthase)